MQNTRKRPSKKNKKDVKKWNIFFWILLGFFLLSLFNAPSFNMMGQFRELTYSEFYNILKNNRETREIVSISKTVDVLSGELSDGTRFTVNVPEEDKDLIPLIRENVTDFTVKPPKTFLLTLLSSLGPILLLIGFWWLMASKGEQLGNRIMGFGKVRPKAIIEGKGQKVTFNDVAGVDEAKEELQEVIEFLKDPKKFQRLGGKIPKGVLLIGMPGCGKTLIAKAVSGEAGVPFFSISGSDFVEMFVGVGASRVRDLFEQGRRAAKVSGKGCIIFIDEIDAVGRLRFSGVGGGHDEREQTLNQLLVEMDGFDTQAGLILIAATNRPDTLDPALLRPGRFDRTIVVNMPDIVGREAILKVHVKKIKLSEQVNLKDIARQTSGFSGADLANLCNEAALLAARDNKESVQIQDLEAAIERVMMGPERKSRIMSKREKEITAFHESGHALLSLLITEVDPMRKISIIPRGMAGGYTLTPPVEDRHYFSKKEILGRLTVALGGRVSEEISLNEVTTGAENDLAIATTMARRMICEFGMSDKLGHITWGKRHGPLFLGRDMMQEKDYSEETARLIDQEVRTIIDECYEKAKKLLEANKEKLESLTKTLLEKEVLSSQEVRKLLGFPAEDEGSEPHSKSTT